MRKFSYNVFPDDACPGGVVTVSENYIRKTYYPYWYSKMVAKYGQPEVEEKYCFEDCIQDWLVVNWGWESDN